MKKSYRVKREQDFNRIFSEGKNVANRKFVVTVCPRTRSTFGWACLSVKSWGML